MRDIYGLFCIVYEEGLKYMWIWDMVKIYENIWFIIVVGDGLDVDYGLCGIFNVF